MRFGTFIPQGWRHDLVDIDPSEQWDTMQALAKAADAGPWESIWVYDHFHTVPEPTEEATHEAWTLMAAFAAVTERVRIGQMCTCMGYRNPTYLAKVAATVDIISGGRTEMGIGAGWYEHEWKAYGYGFPGAGERLSMLREGVDIMKQAWTTGQATLDGKHYQVSSAIVQPTPLQQGGIPLWIAGGGEQVTLKIAAQYADYTNFTGTLDEFDHKSAVLRGHCEAIGRDFGTITRSSNFNTIVADTQAEVAERIDAVEARMARFVGADTAAHYIHENYRSGAPAVGTPEQVIERLLERKAHGLGYSNHYFPEAAYDRATQQLFEQQVIPALAD